MNVMKIYRDRVLKRRKERMKYIKKQIKEGACVRLDFMFDAMFYNDEGELVGLSSEDAKVIWE